MRSRHPGLPVARALLVGAALLLVLLLSLPAHAQSVSIDLGAGGQAGATGRLVQLTALITALSLAPSLLVMVTAFTRIVIVLSLLRGALGAQGTRSHLYHPGHFHGFRRAEKGARKELLAADAASALRDSDV